MKAANALCADVMYSYKNCPEELLEGTIKLKLYDENDPIDELNDECYLFYFEDIDEMVKAMDASNNYFDFTILSIHSFLAGGNPTDRNSLTIQHGSNDYIKSPETEKSDIQKIDELIDGLKAKIFRHVGAQDNKVILFDENNPLIINYFEGEIEVQALGIFESSLCVYFGDEEWNEYNLNDPDDVEKILDGDYWMSAPLTKENNECYIQAIYNIAKRLKID